MKIKEKVLSVMKGKEGQIFRPQQGEKNSRNSEYQFWRQDNQPKECYSPQFSVQKLNYIHNNPVEAGIVEKPEDYLYSSARSYHQQNKNGYWKLSFCRINFGQHGVNSPAKETAKTISIH